MDIGFIGLGKMGQNMVFRLVGRGWKVVGYDPDEAARSAAENEGALATRTIAELVRQLPSPRLIWMMVPHGAVEAILAELTPLLARGDTIIDGGNTPYAESIRRAQVFAKRDVHFLDVGVSGGPLGARGGACLMIGGDRAVFEAHEALFRDLSAPEGYRYVGAAGAGHFVKMVHNGIEYGMMQAIADGFALMRASDCKPNLTDIAQLFNHGSVIESRLMEHLSEGFCEFGEDLTAVSGTVAASGEGAWTVAEAEKLGVSVPAIKAALDFRAVSQEHPSYTGKILSMLRNRFGGHSARLGD